MEAIASGEQIVPNCSNTYGSLTEQNLLDYIRATMGITADDAVAYFDTEKAQTLLVLDSLVEQKLVIRTDYDGVGIYTLSQ